MTLNTWTHRFLTTLVPKPRTIRRLLNGLLLAVAFCALGVAGYQVRTGQWHATPVLSGSMRPAMQPGDIVVTQRVPISNLRVRDVVVFHPPNEADRLTVHRIVKLTVKGRTTSMTTWGDANSVADSTVSSLSGTTAYRVERVVPLMGYPAVWLQHGGRGLLAIGLGALLLIGALVLVLTPEKPKKPTGTADPADTSNPADSEADELEPADR